MTVMVRHTEEKMTDKAVRSDLSGLLSEGLAVHPQTAEKGLKDPSGFVIMDLRSSKPQFK